MPPRSISDYARTLRAELPHDAFAANPRRLAWLPLHVAIIAGSIAAIAYGVGGLGLAAGLSLVIGHSFACIAFVAHETLHGGVLRSRLGRYLVGGLGFLPFAVSPRLWVVWHNQVHHGHTMDPALDPDAYPSLRDYQAKRALRVVDRFALGRNHPAGIVSLLFGFTAQSTHALFSVGGDRRHMSRGQHRLAILETLGAWAFWAALGVLVGPLGFLFAFLIPIAVANTILMSYILTNHSLSPYTDVNDPLLNSLTVTTPRLVEILHLGFGYHVEHHLFPSMSSIHAPAVRRLLQRRWPESYQSLPILAALAALAATPRLHLTATTLVDPLDGQQFPTLQPSTTPRAPEAPPPSAPSLPDIALALR